MTKTPLLAALLAATAVPSPAEPLAEAFAGVQAAASQADQRQLLVRLERAARQRDYVLNAIAALADATPRVGLEFYPDGTVIRVRRGSSAAENGLLPLDVVKEVDGRAMPADGQAIVAALAASPAPTVTVERRGYPAPITVSLTKRSLAASPAELAAFNARLNALSDQIQPLDSYIRAGDMSRDTLAAEIAALLSALVQLQNDVLLKTSVW